MTDVSKVAAGITIGGLAIGLAFWITGSVTSFQGHEYMMIGGGLGSWVVTAAALAILCYWNRQDESGTPPKTGTPPKNRTFTDQPGKPLIVDGQRLVPVYNNGKPVAFTFPPDTDQTGKPLIVDGQRLVPVYNNGKPVAYTTPPND